MLKSKSMMGGWPRRDTSGFTIVELLIVIVVIAILAAITIVAYNGISNRAHDTAAANDFSTLNKKLALFKVENGRYPTGADSNALRGELETVSVKIATGSYSLTRLNGASGSNFLYLDSSDGQNYGIIARTKSMKLLYFTSLDTTVREYTGTYAANFPGMSPENIAADLGLNNSDVVNFYMYSGSAWRVWD